MKLNKNENLKSLEERKTKGRKKRNLLGNIQLQGKMKDDIRYKRKKIENQLLKSKIAFDKALLKTQEDKLSLDKSQQVKTQKMSHSISSFQTKFLFDYFFSSKKPFKFWFTSFRGASPGNNSSLLFSFYDKIMKNFDKNEKEKIRVIKGKKKIYYIIILIIISIINIFNSQETNELSYSYIILKMAKGWNKVFSDGSGNLCYGPFEKPNEVYINGKNQSTVMSFYQFDNEETFVKLIWKNSITSCIGMFCNCGHILELNLSHFNSSKVTSMQIMFQD